jgi:TrmH family RNA methyltransferase
MIKESVKSHIIKLRQKKHRLNYGEFLVEGIKGVFEAVESNNDILTLVVGESHKHEEKIKKIISKLEKNKVPIFYVNKSEANKIKTTETFPGVMAVVAKPEYSLDNIINNKPILAFDKISDPGNIGTIIRTADWFDINNILLSEDSVDPYNEKVVRSTMGSIFRSKIVISDKITKSIEILKKKGYSIVCMVMEGEDISTLKNNNKTVYVFGSESHGIREDLLKKADKKYSIKGNSNKVESLNVAVSAGILMNKIY